jgi:hypothetical protein
MPDPLQASHRIDETGQSDLRAKHATPTDTSVSVETTLPSHHAATDPISAEGT